MFTFINYPTRFDNREAAKALNIPTIIIDDAQRLQPDALQYLRLVSNMVPEQMPPVVFVGRSSFWDAPEQPGSSDAHDLITCRMELERLSDEEAHAFIRGLSIGAWLVRVGMESRRGAGEHRTGARTWQGSC